MSRKEALSKLSDTDREMLLVLSEHRVVTTPQMQTLLDIPERTVRYRLNRLWQHGLAGTERPYAPTGSAPGHWWPSRTADAYARGAPLPRSGEREDPGEQFLEHAAAITGWYVALHRLGRSLGWEVLSFARETEGREEFTYSERTTAVVPDVSVVLRAGEAEYHALVEVDLGTMSMPRLAKKLGLYAAWARLGAWGERHPYLPVLLVATTTPRRVEAALSRFEEKCRWEARRTERFGEQDRLAQFVIGVCDAARAPERALADAVWSARDGAEKLRLADLLREPWRRWAEALRTDRAREREREEYRGALLADPERLRALVVKPEKASRYGISAYRDHLGTLGEQERVAMQLLLEETAPMTEPERRAWGFFARRTRLVEQTDEPRPIYGTTLAVTDQERKAIQTLHRLCVGRQRAEIARLHARYPHLPLLVRAIRDLDAHRLVEWLSPRRRDPTIKEELVRARRDQGRRLDYLAWRRAEVERGREKLGKIERMTFRPERIARALDERRLRVCVSCERIEFLDEHQPSWNPEPHCLACGTADALALAEADAAGRVAPDGEGFWTPCHAPVPDWCARAALPAAAPEPDEDEEA